MLSEAFGTALLAALLGVGLGLPSTAGLAARVASRLSPVRAGTCHASGAHVDTVLIGMGLGIGMALLSAAWPTLAALRLSPLAAMQQHGVYSGHRTPLWPSTLVGLGLLLAAYGLSRLPAVAGVSVFGYFACLALVLGVSCLIPLVFRALTRVGRQTLTHWLGVEGLLALDNLVYALRRCTVATAALLTSFAMMISVSIMIASFKRTVYTWVAQTISADLLIHQASPGGERSNLTMPHRLRQNSARSMASATSTARGIDVEYAGDLVLLVAVDFDVYARYGSFLCCR